MANFLYTPLINGFGIGSPYYFTLILFAVLF
jgi:hypothetical protein